MYLFVYSTAGISKFKIYGRYSRTYDCYWILDIIGIHANQRLDRYNVTKAGNFQAPDNCIPNSYSQGPRDLSKYNTTANAGLELASPSGLDFTINGQAYNLFTQYAVLPAKLAFTGPDGNTIMSYAQLLTTAPTSVFLDCDPAWYCAESSAEPCPAARYNPKIVSQCNPPT